MRSQTQVTYEVHILKKDQLLRVFPFEGDRKGAHQYVEDVNDDFNDTGTRACVVRILIKKDLDRKLRKRKG